MPANYVLTEPAPSTTSYMRSGRGGAGNTFRTNASASSRAGSSSSQNTTTVPLSAAISCPTSTVNSRRFFSGVGGAGNAHKASERPTISLDDEVRRMAAREEHAAAMGHCGIGGAGNVYYRRKASDASESSTSSAPGKDLDDQSSVSSLGSKKGIWNAVRHSFGRD
jgi:hypothetical protein